MKLHLPPDGGVTLIENVFIDQYMPRANGEYVKLYLYLLRCAGAGRDISLSSIADVFDHTEKDVRRALAYWEKLNLLQCKYDKKGSLCDILLQSGSPRETSPASSYTAAAQSCDYIVNGPEQPYIIETQGRSYGPEETQTSGEAWSRAEELTRDRKRELTAQADIRQLIFVAEQYYSRPLSSTEQSTLLYFYDTLHFSVDLIEYLIEYCVSKGSGSIHYMEKVAQEWYRDGITTVAQAKSNSNLYNKNYFTIFNAMGIKGRNPAPAETEIMDRWLNEYDFSIEIILEACCRTIRQTHQPNFQYAGKIMEQWHKAGVHHLSDIQLLDQQHQERQKQAAQQKDKKPVRPSAPNRFNNFTQREYDWNQLEQQLLNAQENTGEAGGHRTG